MQWISTKDRLPQKPGIEAYEQLDCLVYLNGEIIHLVWNCEHLCWDDHTGDDWYCDQDAPSHWMPFPQPPTETQEK
jgi:hypothetical protein